MRRVGQYDSENGTPEFSSGHLITFPPAPIAIWDIRRVYRARSSRIGRDPMLDHVLNHFLSTRKGESGILMGVHSAELLKGCGWVAPPSLSDSVRMDRNNVLKHHN